MTKTPNKAKVSRCRGLIVENGTVRYRRIDTITLFVDGVQQKTLQGEKLPSLVLLDTGKTQEADSVLELFYDKVPRPKNELPVESSVGLNGREVGMLFVGGVAGAIAFAVFIAASNAISTAMSF